MPERILRDYTTSEKFDGFSGSPETLFTRLLTKVDDYGRFDGDPVNVRGACYPRAENLRANTVGAWLEELSSHHLILCYQVCGKRFLAIINFRQRLRSSAGGAPPKPKYPPPEGKPMDFRPDDGDWRELMPAVSGESPRVAASSGKSPPYANTNALSLAESDANADAGDYSLFSKLSPGVVRGVVVRILENADAWWWDNCKVARNGFTLAGLETVLRPFHGRVTIAQVRGSWHAAVTKAHKDAVDGMIKKTPEASCIDHFKRELQASSLTGTAPAAPVNEVEQSA